ncbi:hypothetical protein JMA_42060 (plasmid) [Jeotgalibacillus malaysiensis]|uniref:Uncharacterized protein n=1 Tax=Jeotgalibacillus malaysiensis TaxID=1508404 RepID=A0A0B5AYD5_9BACL|nr:hypothetical protein [Jeotgalibacillus malaysiensis]AJD93523.1 hypothetical protein JMA_42060 [Jeotgalibacillus malaysiensis]
MKENLYKLSHYYSIDDEKQSVFIRTSFEPMEMVKIIGAMNFKFEELVDDSECLDETHMVRVLGKFYPVEDVTKTSRELYPYTELDKNEWGMIDVFEFEKDGEQMTVTQIDIYEAREYCCGAGYKELMKAYLPPTKEFENEMMNLADDYPHLKQ